LHDHTALSGPYCLQYKLNIQRIALLCSNTFTIKIPIKISIREDINMAKLLCEKRVMLRKIVDFKVD